jgi:alpha-1,6-mannosyltransferase
VTQAVSASTAARRPVPPLTVDARRALGVTSLIGLVGTGFLVAVGAASDPTSFVPGGKGGNPGWLHEPLSSLDLGLTTHWVILVMLAMWLFYGMTLVFSDAISIRSALTAIVAVHVVFLLSPPLLSMDVFSYIEYGRLGALHGLNPYLYDPSTVPGDAAFPFIGWHSATSVYGPLFTLGTYATAPLGVGGALWAMKGVTVAASLGCVALVWKVAERLGRRPLEAVMFFGLNPLLLVYAVGGVHNDLLMLVLALGGILLVLGKQERVGAFAAVSASAIKASSAIFVPYLLIGARRRGPFLVGVIAGLAVAAAIFSTVFHAQFGPFVETLRWEQRSGSLNSSPRALVSLVGGSFTSQWVRLGCQLVLVSAVALTLRYAYRGGSWLVAAGWGTFALLATTLWLLPWYVIWLLPIAAVTGDRKLRYATIAMCAFVIGMRLPFYLS